MLAWTRHLDYRELLEKYFQGGMIVPHFRLRLLQLIHPVRVRFRGA